MITRRRFIQGMAGAAAAVGLGGRWRAEAAGERPARWGGAAERTTLGRTGIEVSRLGIGTGTNGWGGSSNQKRLGRDGFTTLLRHALDRGINYIDAADQYGTHESVREALRGLDRDGLFILTKTHASTAEAARADVERFRRELGADVLDCVLLHCMTRGDWPTRMRGAMEALSEAKAAGKVRAVGVSCHGWAPLEASRPGGAADWIDVQLARINPHGTAMDGEPGAVARELGAMHAAGRGVLGMKIFGGGRRTGREERMGSLRFVMGLGSVDAFTIGFESVEQLDETMAMMDDAAAAG